MKLSDAGTVREYIKGMTETFDELSAIGDPTTDEDKVVYLLAGLPESYDVLVTALESGTDTVPSMETVTERLLREEQKLKDREDTDDSKKLLLARYKKQSGPFTCHYCKKPGHFKKDCRKFLQARSNENHENRKQMPHQPRKKSHAQQDAMLISHALAATSKNEWIIDSGASSHMCNEQSNFKEFVQLQSTEKVALGDGSTLDVKGEGTIDMEMILQDGTRRVCVLNNVLYVPNLAYNLVSVSRATDAGKTVDFDDSTCEFRNEEDEVIAFGSRRGTLYFLKCTVKSRECANVTQENTKRLWHRRFGHLCEQSMMNLVKNDLVSKLNCDLLGEVGTCEACVGGKQCKSSFRSSESVTSTPLELVHSDLCGKMGEKSLGGAEYFLTFLDDKTHFAWVYSLKTKDQVFEKFKEWQAEVENLSGYKLKTLRTDNGGEFTSIKFQSFLKSCGVRHELATPKTPEQNGLVNRTLVETTRSMLLDAKLTHKFWAEAVSTATYLRNKSPTSALKKTTPHEAWYGQKPRVDHLRVFGSSAVHTLTFPRTNGEN